MTASLLVRNRATRRAKLKAAAISDELQSLVRDLQAANARKPARELAELRDRLAQWSRP